MSNPLISIVIPTYNRAHLIGETLDSIIEQTYSNWECVIVDDGSTDSTSMVVEEYINKDSRFTFHKRPQERQNGGNAARNFGFEKSNGKYIIWFDSDDLMTEDHITVKVEAILKHKKDFVIAKTQNFNANGDLEPYVYNIQEDNVSIDNFIKRRIHWYTYDVMLTRDIAKQIAYNEQLRFWQDFNYFCKMLLITTNTFFIDSVLTKRRLHEGTIQDEMIIDQNTYNKKLVEAHYINYEDISTKVDKDLRIEMVRNLMNLSFYLAKNKQQSDYCNHVLIIVKKQFGVMRQQFYKLSLITASKFRKGEFLLNIAKDKGFI